METYQIILIAVTISIIISIVISIILYSRQEMENRNYREAHEKIGNCKYNDKSECINSTGKSVEFNYDSNGNPIGIKATVTEEPSKTLAATTSTPKPESTVTKEPSTAFVATTSIPAAYKPESTVTEKSDSDTDTE